MTLRSRSIWTILALVLFVGTPGAFAQVPNLLDPTTLAKYVDLLEQPPVRTPVGKIGGADVYDVHIRQADQKLHRDLSPTTVFTYDGVTPGPTFLVKSKDPIYVNYYNDLPDHHILPVDQQGHLPGAHHVYVGELRSHLCKVPSAEKEIVCFCDAGYKSSIAASLLLREGFPRVSTVLGSMAAWRAAGFPVERQ